MAHPRGMVEAATISPDGRSLLTFECEANSPAPFDAWIWDLETRTLKAGPLRHTLGVPSGWVGGGVTALVAWSPDGRRVATAAGPNRFLDPVRCTAPGLGRPDRHARDTVAHL